MSFPIAADLTLARAEAIAYALANTCTLTTDDGGTVLASGVPCLVAKPQQIGGASALAVRLQGEPAVTIYLPPDVDCPAGTQVAVDGGGTFWTTLENDQRTQQLLQDVPALDTRHKVAISLEDSAGNSRGGQEVLVVYGATGTASSVSDIGSKGAEWVGSLSRPSPFAVALGDRFVLPDGLQAVVTSAPHGVNGFTTVDFQAEQGAI